MELKANKKQTCYYCDRVVDPLHYKTYYHSFTGTYFCTYEHYRQGHDEQVSAAVRSAFEKADIRKQK